MTSKASTLAVALVVALASTACGEPPISADDEAFAAVEAGWQCQVGRRAFADFAAIETARTEFVTSTNLTMERYIDGVKELPDRPALRALVADGVRQRCGSD